MATKHFETDPKGKAVVRMGASGNAALKPRTIPEALAATVAKHPRKIALQVKRDKVWEKWTWTEYAEMVTKAAKSFIKLGVNARDCVGILGFNSPEWFFSDIGAITAGAIPFGIYTTNGPEACLFVLKHSKATVCIVENDVQLRKIQSIRSELPDLKHIVQYTGKVAQGVEGLMDWHQFLSQGSSVPDSALEERKKEVLPESCAIIIYTSGTTGDPKACMLSQDNMTWTAQVVGGSIHMTEEDHLISFLPLSHVAAQMTDLVGPICFGCCVSFASPDALKGSLGETLRDIAEQMQLASAGHSDFAKKVAKWAKKKGLAANVGKQEGKKSKPKGWWLANKLVFEKVRVALGLDRCRAAFSGAAPISNETLLYFLSLNIPVYEVYGETESTGIITISVHQDYRTGSCGKAPNGVELRIINPDSDGNGEIAFRGRNTMMGYMNDPTSTAKDFLPDGFLKTGDIGKVDGEGFLRITGRIKELVITAGGENVPPVPVENAVKSELPVCGHAMLIGDARKFITVVITLKCNVDDDGAPTDELAPSVVHAFKEAGIEVTKMSVAFKDPKVLAYLDEGIQRVNKRAVSNASAIKKWALLPTDFSTAGGELGPTLKLKRRVINKKYEALIEAMYA